MRGQYLSVLPLFLARAQWSFAQETTVYITVYPSSEPSAAPTQATRSVSHAESSTDSRPSVASATGLSWSSSPKAQAISTTASVPMTGTEEIPTEYTSSGADRIDVDAGASGGDSSSYDLSTGGMIAIIIVVVAVAVFGIASTVLFFLAKRRQWNVRASVARFSRRITGRTPTTSKFPNDARSRRTGIMLESPRRPQTRRGETGGVKAVYPPGHKQPVAVNVNDVEKGQGRNPSDSGSEATTWKQRLMGNSWK
ncbi:hypothetical protein MBLNU230_g2922t1 [Neophaeotheca triangularis]